MISDSASIAFFILWCTTGAAVGLFYSLSCILGLGLPCQGVKPLSGVVCRHWTTVFPLIEAGSQIQAGSLTEAGGLKANIIELIAHTPVALWCIVSFVRIARLTERRYGLPGISLGSNKYKTKNLGVLTFKQCHVHR